LNKRLQDLFDATPHLLTATCLRGFCFWRQRCRHRTCNFSLIGQAVSPLRFWHKQFSFIYAKHTQIFIEHFSLALSRCINTFPPIFSQWPNENEKFTFSVEENSFRLVMHNVDKPQIFVRHLFIYFCTLFAMAEWVQSLRVSSEAQ